MRGGVVAYVYSTNKHKLCTISHPAASSPSHPQMAVVSVSGKVNFFRDDDPKGRLLNILSSLECTFATRHSSNTVVQAR